VRRKNANALGRDMVETLAKEMAREVFEIRLQVKCNGRAPLCEAFNQHINQK
jgi:translation elongation factor EF-4